MEYIEPHDIYTSSQVIELGKKGLFPIKSRTTLHRLIHTGKLIPINKGAADRPIWAFPGTYLQEFNRSDEKKLPIHIRHEISEIIQT